MISLLCFADDMVLLALSWQFLQILIYTLFALASEINMSFNTSKTVCMAYNPISSCKIVAHKFSVFTVVGTALNFVSRPNFKYLGNIVTNDDDIGREIKCMFVRYIYSY